MSTRHRFHSLGQVIGIVVKLPAVMAAFYKESIEFTLATIHPSIHT